MAGNRITDNLLRRLQLRVCIGHALSQKRTAIETPHAFSESIEFRECPVGKGSYPSAMETAYGVADVA